MRSLLSVDITARPLIADVLTHMWMTSSPSVRPSWEGPCGGKYSIQNSLASIFHGIDPPESCRYEVEFHCSCFPSNDLQDTMNAGDAAETEATLPALVSLGSEVQEDHSSINTNFLVVLSSSKEQENNPPNQVSNSSSTAITPSPTSTEQEKLVRNKPSPSDDSFSSNSLHQNATLQVDSVSSSLQKSDSLPHDQDCRVSLLTESMSSAAMVQAKLLTVSKVCIFRHLQLEYPVLAPLQFLLAKKFF